MFKLLLLSIALSVSTPTLAQKKPAKTGSKGVNALKILQAAEKIRNPQDDYQVDVLLIDQNGDKKDERGYQSSIKGRNKALVKFTSPPTEKGKRVLMVDADMWVHMPTTSKPIRISPKQRIAGNAAYGDIVRLNFTDNYTATYVRSDKIDDQEAHVLNLTAIPGKQVTYDRIEYWIAKSNSRPLRTYYQTVKGKVLYEGFFDKYENIFGVQRPTEFKIVDYLVKNHVTILQFKNTQKKQFPDLIFLKQNIGRE
jgi:hypothetical protein